MDEDYEEPDEESRRADLLRIVPRGRTSVLDVGARGGYFSKRLTEYFSSVTALDLEKPQFEFPGVTTIAGDARDLPFPDGSFDCVFCAEVLEHVPGVEQACREIIRVARHEIVIGIPYRQDIRVGRTTCRRCGKPNPPWGHINSFTESRILSLFPGLRVDTKSYVSSNGMVTNPVSTYLLDLCGNPNGAYNQLEPCMYCGAKLERPPAKRPVWSRACSSLASALNRAQRMFTSPWPNWVHLVFSKDPVSGHNLSDRLPAGERTAAGR